MKRSLVIGSGHNGLVCACELARAGVQVTRPGQATGLGAEWRPQS